MIEVFKTNITALDESQEVIQKLLEHFPGSKINFDLNDCDNILRIDAQHIEPVSVIRVLNHHGFECEALM